MWAIVVLTLGLPKYILENKQINYALQQQKQQQQIIEAKKMEIELLNKLLGGNGETTKSQKSKSASL